MRARADSVADFFAKLPPAQRATLQKVRRMIKQIVPRGEERISYGMPAIFHEGRIVVWFGAGKDHCAIYPGARPIAENKAALKGYSTSKGTVRFPVDEPLPATLVRKLVKARIAENAELSTATLARKKKPIPSR